jgi:hypothetical protein
VHQKYNRQKPPVKVKRTREEMQTTLKNRRKVTLISLRSAFKTKDKVEGGTSSLIMKRNKKTHM